MLKHSSRPLIEAALFASVAMSLSLIPDFASWFTPSFGAAPLVIFSLRRGSKYGILAGLIWGLLHFPLSKVYYLSLDQVFIEYILAFSAMGLAGLTSRQLQKALKHKNLSKARFFIVLGSLIACLTRYFWHYLAGVIFWGTYAPGEMSPYWYSFTINGPALGFTLLFVLIATGYLLQRHPAFFVPNNHY